MNNNIQVDNQSNIIKRIVKGLGFSFIITLITIFIFSIVLTYTNISESTIPIVIVILTFISILIGTMIGIKKIHKNGMLNGAIIGGTYVLLLYFISSILNTGFTFNMYTVFMIIAGIISGIIGGIIVVNSHN